MEAVRAWVSARRTAWSESQDWGYLCGGREGGREGVREGKGGRVSIWFRNGMMRVMMRKG